MKIDIEEAKYQADKRREAIEKANTLLYYQTDRVKHFHVRTSPHTPHTSHTHSPHTPHTSHPTHPQSPHTTHITPHTPHTPHTWTTYTPTQGALLLSEVLRERGAQLEYKQKKELALKNQDAKYLEFEKAQREAGIRADMEAALKRAKEKGAVAKFQREQ